jgi:8-hydroxy-5-deazaflavin:NADPH oxidoreductase
MKIGIIGAGNIGGTLGTLWARGDHEVMLSSRHPERLDALVREIGPHACAGTVEEAAGFGDVVLLAIPLGGIAAAAMKIGKRLAGKVVLDAMNPFVERDGDIADKIIRRGITEGQATQERFADARVVRAFSSVRFAALQPQEGRDAPFILAIPFASDDPGAREIAAHLIRDAGFEPFDLGSLADSKPQDPGGILFGKALTGAQIAELLHHQKV